MKLKCIKNVQDEFTGKNYVKDITYDFEKEIYSEKCKISTEKRYKQLAESKYFEEIKIEEKPKNKNEITTDK